MLVLVAALAGLGIITWRYFKVISYVFIEVFLKALGH